MNGVLSAIVSTAFVVLGIQMCSAMPGPIVSAEPSYIKVSPGENFTVNVTIDPKGNEIAAADYILRFDNAVLNATSLTQGTFFSGFNTMPMGEGINNTIGMIDYGESIWPITGEGVSEHGTLTTIAFQAIGEHGVSKLDLDTVILSNSSGYGFSNVNVNNGTCEIETVEQTPTPTQTSAPTSGGGSGNGGASVTPTQTPSPTLTPTLTPTPTPAITPLPSPSPTTAISPIPTASMPLSQSEESSNRLPGFEAAFAVIGLLTMSYLVLKGKRR